jgi:5-methyltetrahydropteroyltriglutamate--homocysteine methyltransferase
VQGKPARYAFLPELAASRVGQISIEAAQPGLDCSILAELPGKSVILGVLDLSTPDVELPDMIAQRIRQALPYVDPARLIVAPDCGLKYLTREAAFGKLKAMVEGARLVRAELQPSSQRLSANVQSP